MFQFRFYSACGGFIKVDGVRLGPWEEVVGTVDSVETQEERGVLRITLIRRIGLEIPLNELMEAGVNLVQQTGQKISILRTDEDYILQSKPDDDTRSKIPARARNLGDIVRPGRTRGLDFVNLDELRKRTGISMRALYHSGILMGDIQP